jgi:hypothetical protein
MPSKSPKQKRMMAGAAHDPTFAKKVGVPVKVAKKFNDADSEMNAMEKATGINRGDGDDDSGQDADMRHPQDASQGCTDADEAKDKGASKQKKKDMDDKGRNGGPAAQFGLPRSGPKPPKSRVVLR